MIHMIHIYKLFYRIVFIVILFASQFLFTKQLSGQSLPDQIKLMEESGLMNTGGSSVTGFYDETALPAIYLYFTDPDYWTKLEEYYDTDFYVRADMVIDGAIYQDVGVAFKGNTSYKRNESDRNSIDISLDYMHADQDIEGYNTLNLNNSFQDPTYMREVLFEHFNRLHIPAAKANFCELYFNDEFRGIYSNIQQLNKDFLEEWFLDKDGSRWRADVDRTVKKGADSFDDISQTEDVIWGAGFAALNYLGSDTSEYKKHYTLKYSGITDPWDDLVKVCDVLNNTPLADLQDSLSRHMDIDRTLWFLAHEIIFTDDDSYVFKGGMDYYLYFNPETDRMLPLEFDGNSAMDPRKIPWSPFYREDSINYPLMNRLVQVPELRQRYLAHLRTIIAESFDHVVFNEKIDSYISLIEEGIASDTVTPYTYTEFLIGIDRLRLFFNRRRNFLNDQEEVNRTGPVIVAVTDSGDDIVVMSGENVNVNAIVNSTTGISDVFLYYSTAIEGGFTKLAMFDDGNHEDGSAGDGVFGADIIAQSAGTFVRYYIEALADDSSATVSFAPAGAEHNVFYYRVGIGASFESDIVINELLASNSNIEPDEFGEYDDWVELYNTSLYSISLDGYYLSDRANDLYKYSLSGLTIDAESYLVIWMDGDEAQIDKHASFKLSAGGEELFLTDPEGEICNYVAFGEQQTDISYGRFPNGSGDFIEMRPTFSSENLISTGVEASNTAIPLIYPNPFDEQLFIKFTSDNTETIKVYDSTGREFFTGQDQGDISIETSSWTPGLYIIRFGGKTMKLVKL